MIIIADGGSTKTNWCLINEKGQKIYFNTEGYNPYFSDTDYIIDSLRKTMPQDIAYEKVTEVDYYGAGVHNEEKANIVKKALEMHFPKADVFVGHDLLAAARALLGHKKGFAAILGTGTNTCIYDGRDVALNIDSLAYILGDEGSGCYIGKKLIADYLRGYMPPEVRDVFFETYKLSHDEILDNVYTKPLPNRFLASFSKFVYDNPVNIEYSRNIVRNSFIDFFENLVIHYPNYKEYTFNCIGSVGYNFRNVLEELAHHYGMKVGRIIRSPIDDLVKYHIETKKK
ncbi:N-acetylglucosamine kinase [Daejeonella oryzae]|uniref:N-acetylglucosamine kinase n=1 Tax=Daejeonella oryzae TaxID=1122943 RepID=UPI0003F9C596|nr:N-acetylglucosamine kinase [Daejeonella oryzae]